MNRAAASGARGGIEALAAAVRAGDRRALARAITLVESAKPSHRPEAEALLEALLPDSGRSIRLGITGVPGVGKSTFIERFGVHVIAQGHRVAVLAVDPSSKVSGGSILGDKTRMGELARAPESFIRPSPTGGTIGGVARRSREALLVCEAAGFDVIIVETVGVGQSETAVAEMVDMFLLLLLPAGGDELQGIKRGVMELADLIVVNKADGELEAAAIRSAADYQSALHLLRPTSANWRPEVATCSAVSGRGVAEVWDAVGRYCTALEPNGELAAKRTRQARAWMWREIDDSLLAALRADPAVAGQIAGLEAQVEAGSLPPTAAARRLLAAFLGGEG